MKIVSYTFETIIIKIIIIIIIVVVVIVVVGVAIIIRILKIIKIFETIYCIYFRNTFAKNHSLNTSWHELYFNILSCLVDYDHLQTINGSFYCIYFVPLLDGQT